MDVQLLDKPLNRESEREPDAGNPHVRFEEGRGSSETRHTSSETHTGKP